MYMFIQSQFSANLETNTFGVFGTVFFQWYRITCLQLTRFFKYSAMAGTGLPSWCIRRFHARVCLASHVPALLPHSCAKAQKLSMWVINSWIEARYLSVISSSVRLVWVSCPKVYFDKGVMELSVRNNLSQHQIVHLINDALLGHPLLWCDIWAMWWCPAAQIDHTQLKHYFSWPVILVLSSLAPAIY